MMKCFAKYKTKNLDVIKMSNEETSNIIDINDVYVKINLSYKLVLKNVRHLVGLRMNLISIGILDDDGFYDKFVTCNWKIIKGSLIVAYEYK